MTTPQAMRFEVTALPVADVDRAKSFYEGLGWRLDADFMLDEHTRAVQLTPPGSPASIHFREDKAHAGTAQGLLLVVADIEAAREELIGHGADVDEIWHFEPGKGPQPGVDPERSSYASRASFRDPDGNGWVLQELTERLPGRGGRRTAQAARSSCSRPRWPTAGTRPSRRRTTGGTGTGRTWTRASRAASPTRPPRPPTATWQRSRASSSPRDPRIRRRTLETPSIPAGSPRVRG